MSTQVVQDHGPVMDRTMLSPRAAATRAGCGRSSIMRALSAGDLRATRDNTGQWQITPDALDDWLSLRRSPVRSSPDMPPDQVSGPPVVMPSDTPDTLVRLAAAEARAEALADQVAQLLAKEERLLGIIERLSVQPRHGLLGRLLAGFKRRPA